MPRGIGALTYCTSIVSLIAFAFSQSETQQVCQNTVAAEQAEYLLDDVRTYLEQRKNESSSFQSNGTILPVGSFSSFGEDGLDEVSANRRTLIKAAVIHAWDAYVSVAWGYDELNPVSRKGTNSFAKGLGTTIVDSLSTLYVMGGLDGRYEKARNWVATELNFSKVGRVIVFETVIRVLGGLISMYHLTGDEMYMQKAEELGVRLSASFASPSGLPWPRCYLNETGRFEMHHKVGDSLYLAEVGTVQLEYRALGYHSNEAHLKRTRYRAEEVIEKLQIAQSYSPRLDGPNRALLPFAVSLNTGKYNTNLVTLGAPADSYFEYLVKAWVQGNRTEKRYWDLFSNVMDSILSVATYKSRFNDTIVRDVLPEADGTTQFSNKMDHFACYVPGMIILGLQGLGQDETERRASWERLAEALTDTCYNMYQRSPSGLSGEYIRLSDDDKWRMDGGYHLRPEAVEAFFYMWRHTKNEKYREYAWSVFEQIEKHCRVDGGGYAVIKNAKSHRPRKQDLMHSFLIAETFKYLYLIFGKDEELALDKWVFNTEAHPLLITPALGESSKTVLGVNNTHAPSMSTESEGVSQAQGEFMLSTVKEEL